jgi:hypothetical protein
MPEAVAILPGLFAGPVAIALVLLHQEFDWLKRRSASRRGTRRILRGLHFYMDGAA